MDADQKTDTQGVITPERKQVKVRIAVAVDPQGNWYAAGWSAWHAIDGVAMNIARDPVGAGEARYWLEAILDVPEPKTVEAEVKPDTQTT